MHLTASCAPVSKPDVIKKNSIMLAPRVFVSSTGYDLKYIRENLMFFIKNLGYEPALSEEDSILYDPKLHRNQMGQTLFMFFAFNRYAVAYSVQDRIPNGYKRTQTRTENIMIGKDLLDSMVCPFTRDALKLEKDKLVNVEWGLKYHIRNGIPIMLVDEAELPAGIDNLDQLKAEISRSAKPATS